MKLNFWQWLGIIIVAIALIFIIRRESGERKRPPTPAHEMDARPAVEQPTTTPTTVPAVP